VDLSDAEILGIIEPLMHNCLAGSNEGDHAKHVRDFTERLSNIVTPENLRRQLSGEPRAYFTDCDFIRLFRRRGSIGVASTRLNITGRIDQSSDLRRT